MSWSLRRPALAILVVCVVTTACGSAREAAPVPPFADTETVLLTVHNRSFRNARVYAYWNGVRDRLGMVTASTSQTFSFKWRNEEIQLGYDFMAGRAIPGGGGPFDLTDSYRSPPLPVTQGDHLEFQIRSTNGTLPLPSPYRPH